MEVSLALVIYRHEATLAFLALGAGNASAELYEGETLLWTAPLATPCGSVADGVLTLFASAEAMVLVSGTPDSCRFRNGNGLEAFRLTVSGLSGGGEAKIESEYATGVLYAGGFTRLVGGALT